MAAKHAANYQANLRNRTLGKRGVFFRGCRQEMLIGQFNKELQPGRLQARRMRKSRGLARERITIARRPGSQRKLKNG